MATLPITPDAVPLEPSRSGSSKPKLLHLQILRCAAASLVVVDHAVLGLNFSGAPTAQYTFPAYLLGHIGVAAFFVVSGLIMMRQSTDQFGVPGSPRTFAWHRLIRIVPLYWIATVLRLLSKLIWHSPTPHAAGQLLLSLAFIPDFLSATVNMQPILDIGWTLNFEMSFYLLFTLCLFLPRRAGVRCLILIPMIVPLVGWIAGHPLPEDSIAHPLRALWNFYTDSIIRLFAFGVLIGYLELKLNHLPRVSLRVSPAFVLVVAVAIILANPATFSANWLWVPASCFGAICAILSTVFTLDNPGWFNRFLILLGDASYMTYLFHLWVNGWIVPFAIQAYHHFHRDVASPYLVVLVCVVSANVLGLVIHLIVERPITRALRGLKFGGQKPSLPITL